MTTAADLSFCLFGKHPTEGDHMEGLGLATAALVAFKRDFYIEGLGSCIARSVWSEELPPGTPPPYHHRLLVVSAAGWIAARFQESRDASGRAQYPLVAALSGADHELLSNLQLWTWLEDRLSAAKQAERAEQLAAVAGELPALQPPPSPLSRRAWADRFKNGLERVVHALSGDGAGGRRARVPLGADADADAVLWASFLAHLSRAHTLTLVWRASAAGWADVAFTAPVAPLLQTIFASSDRVPLTSSIPFSISPETRRHTDAALSGWLAASTLFPPPPAPSGGEPAFLEKLSRDFRHWWHS